MIDLRKGYEYEANRVRAGRSGRGAWELIVVRDDKTRQELTIFPENVPCGVEEKGRFAVKEITDVKLKRRKDENGEWTKMEVSVNAIVSPVESEDLEDLEPAGRFGDAGFNSDDPFNDFV